MFMTIAFIIIAILLVLTAIKYVHANPDDESTPKNLFYAALILFLIVSIWTGIGHFGGRYNSIENHPNIVERNIDSKLEVLRDIDLNNITVENIESIEEHNKLVNTCNNLMYRFKVEDRSEYLIDYNYYFELFRKQQLKKGEE